MKNTYTEITWKSWLPVIGLAFSAFVFNTTEFIPIGLLSAIAADFSINEANAGLLITVYAWVVALMSLPLMLLTAKVERRKLLIILFALFIISHLLSGIAWNFTVLVISRTGIACAHAVFWSITAPLAVRLAPGGKKSRALSLLMTGSALATVLGLPLGRMIGQAMGWRMTFLCIAVVAALIALALSKTLPKLPSINAGSLKTLPTLFKRPRLMLAYLLTALMVTAHFTAYTYIEPFIQNIAGFSADTTTFILFVFGAAGIIGSIIFARFSERNPAKALTLPIGVIFLSLMLILPLSFSLTGIYLIAIFWGMAIIAIGLGLQSKVLSAAPDATDIATSLFSAIFNIGIGAGALVGSQISIHLKMSAVGFTGAFFALMALSLCFRFIHLLKQ
jgi:DHA1 family L-arabinose/isopropyl-beta-D-thiogalactopyranoside export protein-like MFS transporter